MSENTSMNLRLPVSDKDAFVERCNAYGVAPPDMLREIIQAFGEGRLQILVPSNQLKILKGIHHHGS